MTYRAPNGKTIIGVLFKVYGIKPLNDIDPDGEPVYSEAPPMMDREQELITRQGNPLFVDSSGDLWVFDELEQDAASSQNEEAA